MHRRHRILFAGLAVLIAGGIIFLSSWVHFLRTPLVTRDEGIRYIVSEGTTVRAVIHDLYLLDVIRHPLFFRVLVWLRGDSHLLQAGEYLFPRGTTPDSLLVQVTTGQGLVYHSFTIVAGWTFQHLRRE